jgi:hypothetical protein
MKYTVEQKAQVMAMQNQGNMVACDFGDVVLITEGHIGYYIKKKDLIIDYTKLKKPISSADHLKPEVIFKATTQAKKTRNVFLIPNGKMAIKLVTDDGKKAWVNMSYLKTFGDFPYYRISGETEAIYVVDIRNNPIGIVMPMRIYDNESD